MIEAQNEPWSHDLNFMYEGCIMLSQTYEIHEIS